MEGHKPEFCFGSVKIITAISDFIILIIFVPDWWLRACGCGRCRWRRCGPADASPSCSRRRRREQSQATCWLGQQPESKGFEINSKLFPSIRFLTMEMRPTWITQTGPNFSFKNANRNNCLGKKFIIIWSSSKELNSSPCRH